MRITAFRLSLAFAASVLTLASCGADDPRNQAGDGDTDTPNDDEQTPDDASDSEPIIPTDDDGDSGSGDGDSQPTDDDGDSSQGDGDTMPPDEDPLPIYGLDERPPVSTCKAFTAPPLTPTTTGARFVTRFPSILASTFAGATGLFQKPGDDSRFFITTRPGRIKHFPNSPTAVSADVKTLLDLSAVTFAGSDCSMASLAFPADYATSKVAYVGYCYKHPTAGTHIQIRMSRFTTNDDFETLDPASEQVILASNYRETNVAGCNTLTNGLHAGDAARFGADGMLYMSIGDGGPQGKCGGQQAQRLDVLRGKLLRFDPHDLSKEIDPTTLATFTEELVYTAVDTPQDNPFAADPSPVTQLIYAYGFRNPWQWHFDRANGQIWVGDVGNGSYEEVDRDVRPGDNMGWGYFEGFQCANGWPAATCSSIASHVPFLEYNHSGAASSAITGGMVYRGTGVPALYGAYFFGDYSRQRIWAVRNVDGLAATGAACTKDDDCDSGLVCKNKGNLFSGTPTATDNPRCQAEYEEMAVGQISSFGEDQSGELYAILLNGTIQRLEPDVATGEGDGGPPPLLSQTGCFEALDATTPVTDLVPFAPSSQLWSDGATKRRWLAVPDATQVTLAADGDFDFPIGTVLVKEFSLLGQKVETRFIVRQDADGAWAGYSYAWNDAQTDATLVADTGAQKVWGTQTWRYPRRSQCFQCHTTVAGISLGLEVAQLNHDFDYSEAGGRIADQMETLAHIGIVDAGADGLPSLPSLPAIDDTTASVRDRARAYLHANCSNCHRPDGAGEGPTFTPQDLRYNVSFADMQICDALPTVSDLEGYIPDNPRIFAPGDPSRSEIYVRMNETDPGVRMPPIGRTLTHAQAVDVVREWIETTTECVPP